MLLLFDYFWNRWSLRGPIETLVALPELPSDKVAIEQTILQSADAIDYSQSNFGNSESISSGTYPKGFCYQSTSMGSQILIPN